MTTAAPIGYVHVRGDSATQHLTAFTVGCLDAPALCGQKPDAMWNPKTKDYDGPARWRQVGLHGTGGTDCPRCAEEVARASTR